MLAAFTQVASFFSSVDAVLKHYHKPVEFDAYSVKYESLR